MATSGSVTRSPPGSRRPLAGSAGPRTVRSHPQIVTRVGMSVRAVRLVRLVVRDRSTFGPQTGLASCVGNRMAPLAESTTTGSVAVSGVLRGERVAIDAFHLAAVDVRGCVPTGVGVLPGRGKYEVGRVGAPSVPTRRTAEAGLAAVVAGVIDLAVVGVSARRQLHPVVSLVSHAVGQRVGAITSRPAAYRIPAVSVSVDVSGPMPAPVSGLADVGHESCGLLHVGHRSRSPGWWK